MQGPDALICSEIPYFDIEFIVDRQQPLFIFTQKYFVNGALRFQQMSDAILFTVRVDPVLPAEIQFFPVFCDTHGVHCRIRHPLHVVDIGRRTDTKA